MLFGRYQVDANYVSNQINFKTDTFAKQSLKYCDKNWDGQNNLKRMWKSQEAWEAFRC